MSTRICVIFPYKPLEDAVFPLLCRLLEVIWTPKSGLYNEKPRPLLVVNRDTMASGTYHQFIEYLKNQRDDLKVSSEADLEKRMDVLKVWSVDTCQMWLSGFGKILDDIYKGKLRPPDDTSTPLDDTSTVLQIPGDLTQIQDFGHFITALKTVRSAVQNKEEEVDFCVGDFEIEPEGSKHLIDVYGTYPLLFNWFPSVALKLRELNIKRPRSEFFAVSVSFLEEMLKKRKFAYEQTMAFLIYALYGEEDAAEIPEKETEDKVGVQKTVPKKWNVTSRPIGTVHDYGAERGFREATDQIERTERMLKVMWRELSPRDERTGDFKVEDFGKKDQHSTAIREAAMVLLQNILKAQASLRTRTLT